MSIISGLVWVSSKWVTAEANLVRSADASDHQVLLQSLEGGQGVDSEGAPLPIAD